jgi:hypothetical protein
MATHEAWLKKEDMPTTYLAVAPYNLAKVHSTELIEGFPTFFLASHIFSSKGKNLHVRGQFSHARHGAKNWQHIVKVCELAEKKPAIRTP